MSWELWKHPHPAPGGTPMFFKAECPKEFKNRLKTISWISVLPSNVFFKKLFLPPKMVKKMDVLLIFEFLCQYKCISKTSSEKFDCRTSRICWKITKILKNPDIEKIGPFLNFWIFCQYMCINKTSSENVFNILVIFQQILEVLHSNFSELVLLMHLHWHKNSN